MAFILMEVNACSVLLLAQIANEMPRPVVSADLLMVIKAF
jgi:hypothetical protein